MRCFFLTLLMAAVLTSQANAKADILSLYQNNIEFDVMREGKVVGEHVTTFKKEGDMLEVSSRMSLNIFLLFIPVYGFDYRAEERWSADRLENIEVAVLDGSDKLNFTATRNENNLQVIKEDGSYNIDTPIISTNHWNPHVVRERQVLNTLTGNINNVTITKAGREKVEITNGSVMATRYDYEGDLTDTSVWYDDNNRWVKLQFKARDGSTIDYRCRTCQSGPAS